MSPRLGPEYDLAQRVADLERRLGTMLQGLGQSFSAVQSDGSVGISIEQDQQNAGATVMRVYQGPNTPRDPETGAHPLLMYIGQLLGANFGDSGAVFFYPSGNAMLGLTQLGLTLQDEAGNVLLANDNVAGEGLSRPYLTMWPPLSVDPTQWPHTSAASSTEITRSLNNMQHPKITWAGDVYTPTGTAATCQLQIHDTSGTLMASSPAVTTTGGYTAFDATFALPAGFYGKDWLTSVFANVTSGPGPVYVGVQTIRGVQS